MKLTGAAIERFLQKPDAAVRVVLIYGPDTGLVRERAEGLAKKIVPDINDPFRTAQLLMSSLSEDTARLHDEMAAQALGGGSRLVRLQSATESLAAHLTSLLDNPPAAESILIIEGGDLDKRSKMRSMCENSPLAAAIPCYVEEGAARERIIADILQASGLKPDRDALSLLADCLPPDRMAMRSELDKLALYAGKNAKVTVEDVEAIVQDAGAAELDDLINAVASGNPHRTATLLDRLLEEQTSEVAILRSAVRHFLRLQLARSYVDQGNSPGEAIKRLQPPVFWKHQDTMIAQVRRWSMPRIEAALTRLFEAEAAVKRTGTPGETLTAHLMLRMAG